MPSTLNPIIRTYMGSQGPRVKGRRLPYPTIGPSLPQLTFFCTIMILKYINPRRDPRKGRFW